MRARNSNPPNGIAEPPPLLLPVKAKEEGRDKKDKKDKHEKERQREQEKKTKTKN